MSNHGGILMKNKGFTLLELMISISLGLLVVAAASILFITGYKSYLMQQGNADLQDNANFGLNYITHDVRYANLNNVQAAVKDNLNLSGVVFTKDNVPVNEGWKEIYKTQTASELTAVTDNSGNSLKSDMLVIQYKPVVAGIDCEGSAVNVDEEVRTEIDGKVVIGKITKNVIQRYYLRTDSNADANEPSKLALVCDAGRYIENGPLTGLGDNSQIIMKRVEYFRVLLEVFNSSNQTRYIDIKTYNDLPANQKPRVIAITLGILARSPLSIGADNKITNVDNYKVLDKTVKTAANSANYIRQVITQNVALRNALGDREQEKNE